MMTGSKLLQCTTTMGSSESLVVLKIFEGESQLKFFHKESSSLNKVKQHFKGETFPGIIHMIDAVVLPTESPVLQEDHTSRQAHNTSRTKQPEKRKTSPRTMIGKRAEQESLHASKDKNLLHPTQPLAYIVYEYAERLDLFTYVAARLTTGDERLTHSLFLQVLNSMSFLHHSCGLAHLDIKLENIVVDSNGLLKLIDFAYCEQRGTRMCISKGTERYFAPEVARLFYQNQAWHPENLGTPHTYEAEPADIFSLGILLFTIFFGQPPFSQNCLEKSPLLAFIGSGDLGIAETFFTQHSLCRDMNARGEISLEFKALLVKMLALDPQQRVPLASLLCEDQWMLHGPRRGGQLTMLEYRYQMEELYLELSGEGSVQQISESYQLMNPEEHAEGESSELTSETPNKEAFSPNEEGDGKSVEECFN
ncbi:hypothetical protein FGO68_gene3635 [Halteria grandinella]|uniref:Protein kinase domain-containing protein n=1 Tax=Halteria grandinella TaxID=5974 RepID=A0A8J8NVY1_HALGN|nr:hypothetical protein FGO68_gene3635 [Halteria grandinella]